MLYTFLNKSRKFLQMHPMNFKSEMKFFEYFQLLPFLHLENLILKFCNIFLHCYNDFLFILDIETNDELKSEQNMKKRDLKYL